MGRHQIRSSASFPEPRARSDGVEKRLLQAAEAGDARAQYNLGILFDNALDDNGYVVEGNRPQAVRWLLAAAEQGLPRAQIKLAEVYADGPDLSGSHATACGWFLLAAMGLRGIHRHKARSGYDRRTFDSSANRRGETLCARLDAEAAERSGRSWCTRQS